MNPTFYKILAHDLRPPLQGGDPLPIDRLPYETEAVVLDSGPTSCAPGWHCVSDLATGFRIAGLWPGGRPARVFEVEPSDDVVERDEKFRSSKLTFVQELDLEGIERGVHDLSKPFGRYRRGMVSEQMAWYVALGRPQNDPELVEAGLKKALKVRGLRWDLKRYDAARDARAAWDARAARDALILTYAAKQGWVDHKPSLLTAGLRDAYHAGLDIAIPTGPSELGWAMCEPEPSE